MLVAVGGWRPEASVDDRAHGASLVLAGVAIERRR